MNELVSRRLPLVGREDTIAKIRRAVQDQATKIVYLEGSAGIGKTMLMVEAGRIAEECGALCSPILDFYDVKMHSHQGLEAAIAESLDPNRLHFADYWRRRAQDPRSDLWDLFIQGYAAVAQEPSVVLRFDTAERLEYERDSEEVRQDCEVDEVDAPSWQWLLRRVDELANTTVLIAARPTDRSLLRQQVLDTYVDRISMIEIHGFTPEETAAYFQATTLGAQILVESPEIVDRVHGLASGRPILIALALDWLERGMWDKSTLEKIGGQDFEAALVEQIRKLTEPLDEAVRYAALCRKGCNAELLGRLMQKSQAEVEALVAELLKLSFVKPHRPGSRDMFFLHDEMYDLVEKYVWLPDWPDYHEQARLDGVIIDWYYDRIRQLSQFIQGSGDTEDHWQLRRELHLLKTERLYYQFDQDPRWGYHAYLQLEEDAIRSRELEQDIWFRNEALWFLGNRAWRKGNPDNQDRNYPQRDPMWRNNEGGITRSPAVECDSRRWWVNRYIAQGHLGKAVRIAWKLLSQDKTPEEPELYRSGVEIALATALAYMGGSHVKEALQHFDISIKHLQAVENRHREQWLYPFLLGTAYLDKGLALRKSFPFAQAREAYKQAITLFRSVDYLSGLAEAENNLAFLLSRMGKLKPAMLLCEDALRIRRDLGDEYALGLSLNTKAILLERLDRPVSAIHFSKQALSIFGKIDSPRGVILASINLGRAYRRRGRSRDWANSESDFLTGKGYLDDAIKVQDSLGDNAEVYYQIEAHNELGCLYRDWVATLYPGVSVDKRLGEFLEKAEDHLNEAIALSQGEDAERPLYRIQSIDSLEDLARVYYWRARCGIPSEEEGDPLDVMADLLDKAESVAKQHLSGWGELRLILGKIYFQRARRDLEFKRYSEAASHFALAAGYAESYSADAPELEKFVSLAASWLMALRSEDAETYISTMQAQSDSTGLRSKRLQEWIDSVVLLRPAEDWEGEVDDG